MNSKHTEPSADLIAFHAGLLDGLRAPPLPKELRQESFLEEIYGRAAAATAAPLESLLRGTLTPSVAPDDACWRHVEALPDLPARVAATAPDATAPRWIWARIKADVRRADPRGVHRASRARPLMRLAAAAAIFVAGLVAVHAFLPGRMGTSDSPRIVFKAISDQEFDAFERIFGG